MADYGCIRRLAVVSSAKAVRLGLSLAACLLVAPPGSGQSAKLALLPNAPAPTPGLLAQETQSPPRSSDAEPPRLTLAQAEEMALQDNPRVRVGRLLAMAQHQVVREARSADLPSFDGSITAVDALNASRLADAPLTSSHLFPHAGAGGSFSQLITDFGRTHNLVLTQKLEAEASNANALATREEIVLAADKAFYDALTAQALLQVASQTVNTRQTIETKVRSLTQNKLKSTLDLAFADVLLSQSKLLQLDAQNNADAAMASLDAVLGLDHEKTYRLVDNSDSVAGPPIAFDPLIQKALAQRPDLQSVTLQAKSAQRLARAQWDQLLPSIMADGTAGAVPVRSDTYYTSNWWGAVGVNMNIPLFNGFLYSSQAKEAAFRAKADAEHARDLRDQTVREVRTAWLQANTAYQRLGVTAQLLAEAKLSFQLAQARYRLGLSSIVELSQAQLQQTSAEIDNTNSRYQYGVALATLKYEEGTNP